MLHGSSFHVGRKVCIIILFFFCSFDVMSVCFSFFLFFSSLVITHTFFFSLLRSFFLVIRVLLVGSLVLVHLP